MKISTRGRYALRMMIEIGLHEGQPTKINQVAKNQKISIKYLEQIVSLLVKANLLKSIRGAHGGYVLTKPPKEYSLGEILRITEGSLSPVKCLEEGNEPCNRSFVCVTRRAFQKIENAINEVVDNISLEDLLNDEKKYNVADDIRNTKK